MECLRLGVNPSASLTVRTNPDSSLQIFRNRQHRTGEMVFIVISQVFVLIETIESVFVRADPCPAFAIYEDARYTGFTDRVQCSQLIAHIVE